MDFPFVKDNQIFLVANETRKSFFSDKLSEIGLQFPKFFYVFSLFRLIINKNKANVLNKTKKTKILIKNNGKSDN